MSEPRRAKTNAQLHRRLTDRKLRIGNQLRQLTVLWNFPRFTGNLRIGTIDQDTQN